MNAKVLRNLSYGVYVIGTMDGERPTGCVANSAMQITSSPATIALSMNHDNYTNRCIERSGVFSLTILSEKSDPRLIGTFGFQSGKDVEKFDGVAYEVKAGAPVVKGGCGHIVCKVIDKMETNTHTVFLGEVIDGDVEGTDSAMTYAYYHNVVKGKSPKNAPTYIPEEADGKKEQWVCSVCGYVYEGDTPFEELPESYVCPVCKQPKTKFEKK